MKFMYGSIVGKGLSQERNDALPNSGTKPRVDNTVANLCSYPLSCTSASWDISVLCLSQGHNSALGPVWASN